MALKQEVEKLARHGPGTEELKRTETALYAMLIMGQETPDARVMRLGRYALDQRTAPPLEELKDQLGAVTVQNVRDTASRLADWEHIAWAEAGPIDHATKEHEND